MATVGVIYYDAECVRCGWQHRVMYGDSLGAQVGHTMAVARHGNATFGRCTAYPDEIREQQAIASGRARPAAGTRSDRAPRRRSK